MIKLPLSFLDSVQRALSNIFLDICKKFMKRLQSYQITAVPISSSTQSITTKDCYQTMEEIDF